MKKRKYHQEESMANRETWGSIRDHSYSPSGKVKRRWRDGFVGTKYGFVHATSQEDGYYHFQFIAHERLYSMSGRRAEYLTGVGMARMATAFAKKVMECEHGKGLTDYCEPCGRINSA
ncbi:hypothetical protein LCGC14_1720240 [marine sediment metagenome]|uniref:Uncharacterized protein n=1 Tax=marine sediment metagenome TaxID=412755 RepID=A0A0F9KCI4_9ZZZZ